MLTRIRNLFFPPVRVVYETPDTLAQLPQTLLTPFSVKYIRQTVYAGGVIATLRKKDKYLSLAVLEDVGHGMKLEYVITAEAYRHKGYASQLLTRIMNTSIGEHAISASVNQANEYYPYIRVLLTRAGFELSGEYSTFVVRCEDAAGSEDVQSTVRQIERFSARFSAKGYRCVSFRDAAPALLEQVRDSSHNSFANPLDPKSLFDIPGYILPEYSFVLEKDGQAAAYSIVSDGGNGIAEFDQLAAAAYCRTQGYALPPMAASFRAICDGGRFNRFMYQIFDNNTASSSLMNHIMACPKAVMRIDFFRRRTGVE